MNALISFIKKYIFIILVVISVGGYCIWDTYKIPNTASSNQVSIKNSDIVIKQLQEKYGAISDWEKQIRYTLDMQNALITDKPVMFRVTIQDVYSKNGKYFIKFAHSWLDDNHLGEYQDYILDLECNSETAKEIINTKNDGDGDYIVVAKINSVTKPILKIQGILQTSDQDENNEVELDSSTDTFIAGGILIDMQYIKENLN